MSSACLGCGYAIQDRAYEIVREWEEGREFSGLTRRDFGSYSSMRVRAHEIASAEIQCSEKRSPQ